MIAESDMLSARLKDAQKQAECTSSPKYVGFLSDSEVLIAKSFIEKLGAKARFFGGYDDAVRKIVCFLPDWADDDYCDFPITPVKASFNPAFSLTHRDILGALMALGIKRSSVGDIVVSKGTAAIFLHSDIANYVISQLEKAGRVALSLSIGIDDFSFPEREYGPISGTVASARLDCVVGALAGDSREKAAARITSGGVKLNGSECKNVSAQVSDSAVITILKRGKYIIDSISQPTKKGRLRLQARKMK